MRDPRLEQGRPAISAKDHARARSAGLILGASSPDLKRMRAAIEAGSFYSSLSFISGFADGLTDVTRESWTSWLFDGLGERGAICEAYRISGFVEDVLEEWQTRKSLEPWSVFEAHTGAWGAPCFVPAQLLSAISREHWHKRLDNVSVPSLLLWLAAAGDASATRENWLNDLATAPLCFRNDRPTGMMRGFAMLRLFVEHCEALEQAPAPHEDPQLAIVPEIEFRTFGTQLIDSISRREDAHLLLAHFGEHLASRQLFGHPSVDRPGKRVVALFLERTSEALQAQGASTLIYKKVDGQRRKGHRRWVAVMAEPVVRIHSQPSDPEIPEGEATESNEEVTGLGAWVALAALHSRAPQHSSCHDEVWALFAALLEKRDRGFSRLDFYPHAREHLTQVGGNVLANCSDPLAAWMAAYVSTEPHRRRAGFPHRYIDLSVGIPTRVLVEVGGAAATMLRQPQLYEAIESAARRMWLVRPGSHGIDWENLYASVLAQCSTVYDDSVSKLLELLEVGSNAPTLVCSTLEYWLQCEPASDLPRKVEDRFGVRVSALLKQASLLHPNGPEAFPLLGRNA